MVLFTQFSSCLAVMLTEKEISQIHKASSFGNEVLDTTSFSSLHAVHPNLLVEVLYPQTNFSNATESVHGNSRFHLIGLEFMMLSLVRMVT